MRAGSLLGGLLLGLRNASGYDVELKELANPTMTFTFSEPFRSLDETCAPDGCRSVLTRDGSLNAESRFGCTMLEFDPFDHRTSCLVSYDLNEDSRDETRRTISSVHVAFTADSENSLQVQLNNIVVVESWTGEQGSTALQEIPGLAGFAANEVELIALMDPGDYVGITEVQIFVDVDDVPVTGISASERVGVTASATVNDGSAANTLDGSTTASSSWSCSEGDVCEITYDMQEVQSTQQLRIAFVDDSSTAGSTFNVYTAGADGIFSAAISGATAGPRDPSLEGLQTFGGMRSLARYVKIEGVPGSGGEFSITEVDIRVNEDAPTYPTSTVDSSLVPVGRIPLADSVPFDPRPASEGGCSVGPFEGCNIYNIKDGDNSPESRWACSPTLGSDCEAEFDLNTQRYLRQIQLAFHNGDQRHNEFSIHVQTEGAAGGWLNLIPSAISSGDTTDFQTWDLPAWTSAIEIRPAFGNVGEWFSVKEMVLLEQKQSSRSTPVLEYNNEETGFTSDVLPIEKTKFSFDLENVGSVGSIEVGGGGQTARIWALKFKFAPNKAFTFDIRYNLDDEDRTEVSTRFTSAGGPRRWERFVLPERMVLDRLRIVAVEGPDIEDYPTLRVSDCQVLGKPYSPGSSWVASTTLREWNLVPDYIGDGNGDQEEIMEAICDGIGESFDGTDCDGVATGNDQALEVILVHGDFYLDGPVFLKSGISLMSRTSHEDQAILRLHGSGTGADGVITANGVSNALVNNVLVVSNRESAGAEGTVGNVCFDIKDSEDIIIDDFDGSDCPLAATRITDADRITMDLSSGRGTLEGPGLILDGVTDFTITESLLEGVSIKDSVNILFEGKLEDGEFVGNIRVPEGGDQSANLVVSGTSSGVTLKNFTIWPDAEPRIILENSNPFTIDGVWFRDGIAGDCIVQFPQGSDGNAILTQLNVLTELALEGNCFVLV